MWGQQNHKLTEKLLLEPVKNHTIFICTIVLAHMNSFLYTKHHHKQVSTITITIFSNSTCAVVEYCHAFVSISLFGIQSIYERSKRYPGTCCWLHRVRSEKWHLWGHLYLFLQHSKRKLASTKKLNGKSHCMMIF